MNKLEEIKQGVLFELNILEGCIKSNEIAREVYLKILEDIEKIEGC